MVLESEYSCCNFLYFGGKEVSACAVYRTGSTLVFECSHLMFGAPEAALEGPFVLGARYAVMNKTQPRLHSTQHLVGRQWGKDWSSESLEGGTHLILGIW